MPSKYQATLKYMFTQLPMYQRVGAQAFKKDLTNIIALCSQLGNPHDHFTSIHVAGTNGKGSTSHILAAALQAHGLKVGVYTSPHYLDFRERIKINGEFISEKQVVHFIDACKSLFDQVRPSFFEMTVAMAFDHFRNEHVDIAIIEVGLGGRLDSTNILKPMLSVITNISFDHQSMLGNTLIEIAGEKAGIIKSKVPVIIGEKQQEVVQVFMDKAEQVGTTLLFAENIIRLEATKGNNLSSEFNLSIKGDKGIYKIKTDISGPYQIKNIRTALGALYKIYNVLDLDWGKVVRSLQKIRSTTRFMGRWQQLSHSPQIIADSAHNLGGLVEVLERLQQVNKGTLHCVLGFVNDKDLDTVLQLFPDSAYYYFVKADIPRGMNASELMKLAARFDLKGKAYSSVRKGLAAARVRAKSRDTIFIGGSIFVVAEVI